MSGVRRVCILGFGEVGQVLADDLGMNADLELHTFDPLLADRASVPSLAAATRPAVATHATAWEAVTGSDLIISVVTASEALVAARSAITALSPASYYVDLNSVSPHTKRETASTIEAAGGNFVEGAIMSPIGPHRINSPILLGGPHAAEFITIGAQLGFSGLRHYADQVGPASAVKMCRSVVIKGMEALLAEALAAARHYGAEETVLASLGNVLPVDDWPGKARYMISRSLQHGARRAEEMREVAKTVAEAGLAPHMSHATVERQEWAGRYAAAVNAPLPEMLDTLLANPEDTEEGGGADG